MGEKEDDPMLVGLSQVGFPIPLKSLEAFRAGQAQGPAKKQKPDIIKLSPEDQEGFVKAILNPPPKHGPLRRDQSG